MLERGRDKLLEREIKPQLEGGSRETEAGKERRASLNSETNSNNKRKKQKDIHPKK